MKAYQEKQIIQQLEKRKGGYFYLTIKAELVNTYVNKRQTRFICTLDKQISFRCGLNHLGDGNYFIILSGKNLETIGKSLGDQLTFELVEDPDPLGVEVPEVLTAVLAQDDELKSKFERLTLGKKRGIIHSINRVKNIDKQIEKTFQLLNETDRPSRRRKS